MSSLSTIEPRMWDYRVSQLVRCVDGDTFDLTLEKRMDFGFRLVEQKSWSTRFRLLGVDTFELNEAGGASAKVFAEQWILDALFHDMLRGQTFKADNFGRWLIDLYRLDTNEHLADVLIRKGHGVVYSR